MPALISASAAHSNKPPFVLPDLHGMVADRLSTGQYWCQEYLPDSPSTSSLGTTTKFTVSSSSRKRPYSELPHENIVEEIVEEPSPKKRSLSKILAVPSVDHVMSDFDTAIHYDTKQRALNSHLIIERTIHVSRSTMLKVQGMEILQMRLDCIKFMSVVAEQLRCDVVIFPLAVQYFDRYLCLKKVPIYSLMMVSLACISMALKVKSPTLVSMRQLAQFSMEPDNLAGIPKWESAITDELEWNVFTPTAFEFFDQILARDNFLSSSATARDSFISTLVVSLKDIRWSCLLPSYQMALVAQRVAPASVDLVRDTFPTLDWDYIHCMSDAFDDYHNAFVKPKKAVFHTSYGYESCLKQF